MCMCTTAFLWRARSICWFHQMKRKRTNQLNSKGNWKQIHRYTQHVSVDFCANQTTHNRIRNDKRFWSEYYKRYTFLCRHSYYLIETQSHRYVHLLNDSTWNSIWFFNVQSEKWLPLEKYGIHAFDPDQHITTHKLNIIRTDSSHIFCIHFFSVFIIIIISFTFFAFVCF